MEIPNITKNDIEILGLSDFIQENLKSKNDSKELTFEKNGFTYRYLNENLLDMEKITADHFQKPIPRRKKQFNSPEEFKQAIQTLINFYPDNTIHTIKQFNNNSNGYFPAGNWYTYDEQENLLKHIDHEKFFKMNYYDIAQIADSYDYASIQITRRFDERDSIWLIILAPIEGQRLPFKYIYVDDKSGKIIYELSQEEFNSLHRFDAMETYQKQLYKLFIDN